MKEFITKTVHLKPKELNGKKDELLQYFNKTYDLYESLFDCISDDRGYYEKANTLRHPLIFYFAHTAVFYINKLKTLNYISEGLDEHIETTMAVGVDEMSWDDLDDSKKQWPSIDEVSKYRKKAKALLIDLINVTPLTDAIDEKSFSWIIMMGIEHERIHLETSSVLMRELPISYVKKTLLWHQIADSNKSEAPSNSLVEVNGAEVNMGVKTSYPYYYWDNEKGEEKVNVDAFRASKYLVSNLEFSHFIKASGYTEKEYWSDDGWSWLQFSKYSMPKFWIDSGSGLKLRVMLDEIDMPWDWPAEVNFHESQAFCRWKSSMVGANIRLPSEPEYRLMRSRLVEDQPDWIEAPGNINLEHFTSPCAVGTYNHNGLFDIIGNVWQWSETPIHAFEGFEPHPAYDDFSVPTFDNAHMMIKGGSWASTGNLSLQNSRYSFRKHFYQHAGFRYIESERCVDNNFPVRTTDQNIAKKTFEQLQPFNQSYFESLVQIINQSFEGESFDPTILNFHPGSGKLSLSLVNKHKKIIHAESSANKLRPLQDLVNSKRTSYEVQSENKLRSYHELTIDEDVSSISLVQCTTDSLSRLTSTFDLVILDQCMGTMSNITESLSNIKALLNTNGRILISTDYDFLDKDFSGFKSSSGESFTGLEALLNFFKDDFEIQQKRSLEYTSFINDRKKLVSNKDVFIWKKK